LRVEEDGFARVNPGRRRNRLECGRIDDDHDDDDDDHDGKGKLLLPESAAPASKPHATVAPSFIADAAYSRFNRAINEALISAGQTASHS